jgi:membrane protein YqaA with SNARE-associated domain
MLFFGALYDKVLSWSRHRKAPWYLGGLSFAESSFFPIPPDVMLAPMVLARPSRAWILAGLTTGASVAGGVLGYLIGLLAIDLVEPLLHRAGYYESYLEAHAWFERWGVWVVFIAGFSPIPYKVFTISAGALAMPFLPFVIASLVGRGARFFLVAWVIRWGGARFEPQLRRYIDVIGLTTVAALVVLYFIVR